MNTFTLLPSKVKIPKCPSYFSGVFISPDISEISILNVKIDPQLTKILNL